MTRCRPKRRNREVDARFVRHLRANGRPVPAVEVGVVGALGNAAVVEADNRAAAVGDEQEAVIRRAARAESRKQRQARQRIIHVVSKVIQRYFDNKVAAVQTEYHETLKTALAMVLPACTMRLLSYAKSSAV